MLRVFALLIMMLISNNLFAADQTRYVSENIFIYVHGGPGTQYRIIGSAEAGQPLTYLDETQNDFSKIIDAKGRTGWIKNDYISNAPSFRITQPKLEKSLTDAQQQLAHALELNKNNNEQIALLSSQLKMLKTKLAKATSERDQSETKLNQVVDNQDFLKWREGGIIAVIGLILGLVITYLPRPQRRNKERWM